MITAPVTALKLIQSKLAQVLSLVYEPKPSVHGFIRDRSIISNARPHRVRRYVLNVDLRDFFPSINFGRVRGLFMARPYQITSDAATVLAQICCFDNQLPQGAPTSPVVSNMICNRMDTQLQQLAGANRCFYTRYVDDLTFSSSEPQFPSNLASPDDDGTTGRYRPGTDLERVVQDNGFTINPTKVRLQIRPSRQVVTGLTVNNARLNVSRRHVRQIRAMLHAWRVYGRSKAEQAHQSLYAQYRNPSKRPPQFQAVVKGKIVFLGMVRGKGDKVYRGYADLFQVLTKP